MGGALRSDVALVDSFDAADLTAVTAGAERTATGGMGEDSSDLGDGGEASLDWAESFCSDNGGESACIDLSDFLFGDWVESDADDWTEAEPGSDWALRTGAERMRPEEADVEFESNWTEALAVWLAGAEVVGGLEEEDADWLGDEDEDSARGDFEGVVDADVLSDGFFSSEFLILSKGGVSQGTGVPAIGPAQSPAG